jgi:hypothetical protein
MAVAYMTSVNISNYNTKLDDIGWEYNDTLATPGNGSSVINPDNVKIISVTLQITAGQGKVQATTSLLSDVLADTAVWVDWDAGNVTATTQDTANPVTAIRQVNTSGTTKMMVRAQ